MRMILGWAAVVALATAGGAAADEKKGDIDAKKLVGKWEPKEAKEGRKLLVEFTKDGKVSATVGGDGKEFKMEGTYKLTGNKLSLQMKKGDEEKSQTRTITKLTDTELVSKTEGDEKEDTLVRVKK